jgi:uncharacterized protein YjiS (DUF1127 family)
MMSNFRIYRFGQSIARWRQNRESMRALERLDDRMLSDMGIARSEIYRVVRQGREL